MIKNRLPKINEHFIFTGDISEFSWRLNLELSLSNKVCIIDGIDKEQKKVYFNLFFKNSHYILCSRSFEEFAKVAIKYPYVLPKNCEKYKNKETGEVQIVKTVLQGIYDISLYSVSFLGSEEKWTGYCLSEFYNKYEKIK